MIEAFVKIIPKVGKERDIFDKLRELEVVKEAYIFFGSVDIMVKVEAEDERGRIGLREIISEQIAKIADIEDIETLIIFDSFHR